LYHYILPASLLKTVKTLQKQGFLKFFRSKLFNLSLNP